MTLFAGTNKAGTWRASLTIPAGTSGIHYVCFQATDIAGNTTRIAWAIEQGQSVPLPDTTRPVISSGSISKASAKFGESITFTFTASDNVGVAYCHGIVYGPDDYPVFEAGNSSCSLISGTAASGTYRATVNVPSTVYKGGVTENNPIGVYKIFANAQDAATNSTYVSGANYVSIGTIQITGS